MNYHLNRNGVDLGILTLEELRRRRLAAELTGAELVWCEGMAEWQTLDTVLQQPSPAALAPAPVPRKPFPTVRVVILCVVALLVGVAVVGGMVWSRYIKEIRTVVLAAQQGGAGPQSALSLAGQPILFDSNTLTAASVRIQERQFRLRQYVEGYELRGERNPECDDLCLGFLKNWVAANYGGEFDTNLPSLAEMSNQLVADPQCTDPLVLTAAAVNTTELHETLQRLERAIQGFDSSKHRGYPKFFATVSLASRLIKQEQNRQASLDRAALQYFTEALGDGSLKTDDQEEMSEILIDGWASQFFFRNQQAVFAAVQSRGDDFKWLALVLEGQYEINEAWRMRGGGYADTVTAEGARGFADHLARADTYLTQAWQLQPRLPMAPSRMVYVALGTSGLGDMRIWFDRATMAQLDFADAWGNMRWGLRPRWYGSQEAMLALGVAALETRRFDTDVPRKFFDTVKDVEEEMQLPAGTYIYGRDDIWPHVREMYEGYLAEPTTTPDLRDGWRSTYATVAYLAGKYDVARQQLEAIHWQPGAWSLTGWRQDLTLLPLAVAARTGSQSNLVAAAESLSDDGDTAGALTRYQSLSNAANLDERTRSFVRERMATLDLEKRLQSHDWVDFLPTDTNMTGWHVEMGHCTVNTDGSLDVRSGETGHLLFARARMGPNFEVRGTFEVERSSTKSFQGGLVMGLPQYETYGWYGFRIKRNTFEGDVSSFSQNWTSKQVVAPVSLDDYTNTFDFRFQNGLVTATVDNQKVFDNVVPPQANVATNEFVLGLGAFNDMNDTVIRYRGVQARLLASP